MPHLDIHLTEKQHDWLADIAEAASKKDEKHTEFTQEQWLFRQLRSIATQANAVWIGAEKADKFEFSKGDKKWSLAFKEAPVFAWPEDSEQKDGMIRLYFSEKFTHGLLCACSLEDMQLTKLGGERTWHSFAEWISETVNTLLYSFKPWADGVSMETEEEEQFANKKPKMDKGKPAKQ
jgi:hypothetical protein